LAHLAINPVVAVRVAAINLPGFGHDESRVMHRHQFADQRPFLVLFMKLSSPTGLRNLTQLDNFIVSSNKLAVRFPEVLIGKRLS
jgi:hypothetical protein